MVDEEITAREQPGGHGDLQWMPQSSLQQGQLLIGKRRKQSKCHFHPCMRRGPKGQLIVHLWSHLHTAGTNLALVLQTQQQGQKWTKMNKNAAGASLPVSPSIYQAWGKQRQHQASRGISQQGSSPITDLRDCGDLYLWICFQIIFLLMMLKKGVSTQRKI